MQCLIALAAWVASRSLSFVEFSPLPKIAAAFVWGVCEHGDHLFLAGFDRSAWSAKKPSNIPVFTHPPSPSQPAKVAHDKMALKIKELGLRRFWSMFLLTRVPFR